jgi:hypothetical protein
MSFPSGLLRWTGSWSATRTYLYGDIALASTNVSYACGVPTSLNVDPATQPSTDWFGFPPSGGGSPTSWSEYPATQLVRLNQLANLEGDFGLDGQVLSSDGTKIQWVTPSVPAINPPQLIGQTLSTPVTINIAGTTVLELLITPTIQCQASVTVTVNYETMAPGADTLTLTLKSDIGSSSVEIDSAELSSFSLGGKQSCALSGVLPSTLLPNVQVKITLSAESSGNGAFNLNKANMSVLYNIPAQS